MMSSAGIRIIGAGGQGRIAAEAWLSRDGAVLGFYADTYGPKSSCNPTILGAPQVALGGADFVHVAIGNNRDRMRIVGDTPADRFPLVVHALAVVSASASVGCGSFVGVHAIIQANASIGAHVIVNTAAVVEHDCEIGDFAHIAPRAVLGGNVAVGACTLVGIGAVILPGVRIGSEAIVGAGSVVVRDVPDGVVVAGNPARLKSGS